MILNKLFRLHGIKFFPADQGTDGSALIAEDLPVAKPFENCIGSGALPSKPFFRQLRKSAGRKGLIGPDNIRKDGLNLSKLVFAHVFASFTLLSVDKRILHTVDTLVNISYEILIYR